MPKPNANGILESSKQYGSRLGLERVARLCEILGNPQDAVPAVHVAGTNGKGSVSTMVASALNEASYKTGLYTSPYVLDPLECYRIGGAQITQAQFSELTVKMREPAALMAMEGDPPTEFEIETAMAFLWFQQQGCDACVIEVGLGGRLDATNVLKHPLASVITSISLDHTAILGNSLAEIAAEKCGIIKPGGITVSDPMQSAETFQVIRDKAHEASNALVIPCAEDIHTVQTGLRGTEIVYKGLRLYIPLMGTHQVRNAVTAVETVRVLRERCGYAITDSCIAKGIRDVRIPMRQEIVQSNPLVLLDGAHNPDGLAALADTIKTLVLPRRTAVVMGMLADKEYLKGIALIAALCGKFIAVAPQSPRALPAPQAAECARPYCADVTAQEDYDYAMAEALEYAGGEGAVVVCGSFYVAGPMQEIWFEKYSCEG